MTALLLFGMMAAAFFLATAGAAWLSVKVAARLPLELARSSRVRAGLVVLPVAIGTSIAISLLSPLSWLGGCHCVAHPHHVHLCFEHTAFSWALACCALLGGAGGLRSLALSARVLGSALETRRWSSRIPATPGPHALVDVVAELGAHAVTVGIRRPRVMIGASLWSSLDADGRRAVQAHEHAHVERRDLLTLLCLKLAACAMPASFGRRLVDDWKRAAELACDRAAANAIGDPCALAAALVTCGKLQLHGRPIELPTTALAIVDGDDLEARVACLLNDPRPRNGNMVVRGDLLGVVLAAFALTITMTLLGGASAHHGAETLLGWIS
jgi:hypothetical protein